jgi:calcineurin-like phosphoesterase family protein
MADTWFTSDFHFGHFNIIRYCNRPFASTEEMNGRILGAKHGSSFEEARKPTKKLPQENNDHMRK